MSKTARYSAKKEAKRLEREAKLAAKAAKQTVVAAATGEKKAKEKKERKEEEDVPFVNTTPKGEKKGTLCTLSSCVFD